MHVFMTKNVKDFDFRKRVILYSEAILNMSSKDLIRIKNVIIYISFSNLR